MFKCVGGKEICSFCTNFLIKNKSYEVDEKLGGLHKIKKPLNFFKGF